MLSDLHLDRGSETPLYRQLHAAIAGKIASGELAPGARLPSVRRLAAAVSVSPITIVLAYNVLADGGLIRSSAGRGTYVADPSARESSSIPDTHGREGGSPDSGDPSAASPVYLRAPRISAMQALLRPGRRAHVISLAAGTPDPSLFPIRAIGRLWSRVMAHEDPRFLQYGTPHGDPQLRAWVADRCAEMGIAAHAQDILVTSGSQQAIDIIARTFVGSGDYVLVESPTFLTALDIFEGRGANLIGIPVDHKGLRTEVADALIERYRPRLLYTIPTGQNPTGTTLADDRRQRLAALARRHNMLILEDDICSEFAYDGRAPKAIKAHDGSGHIIFILSFSKTVVPGLRVGCVIASPPLMGRLLETKALADRFTSPLIQRTLWRYLTSSQYGRDLKTARDVYRRRRDALIAVLKQTMPPDVGWTHPTAGFNMWLQLPDGVSASEVVEEGLKEGVACAVGDLCLPHLPPPSGLRISFADNTEAVAAEGVRRLARAIVRMLEAERKDNREAEFVTTI